jgi:hypothetical protein
VNDVCKTLIREPYFNDHKWLLERSRQQLRNLTSIITGHCNLRDHLFTIGLSETRLCRFCEADAESAFHILSWCQHYRSQRILVFGFDVMDLNNLRTICLKDIFKFLTLCNINL